MIVGGILPKVWICMEDCQLTKHVLMKLQKCLNSAQLKQKWIFQGSYDTLRYTFWVDRVLLRSVWKWGTPHIQPVMRRYHIKNCYYRHHYLLFTMLYLWNIWLKLPEGTVVRRFFPAFLAWSAPLFKRHSRRIPLLSHWHVHLHADSTGDAKDGQWPLKTCQKPKVCWVCNVRPPR